MNWSRRLARSFLGFISASASAFGCLSLEATDPIDPIDRPTAKRAASSGPLPVATAVRIAVPAAPAALAATAAAPADPVAAAIAYVRTLDAELGLTSLDDLAPLQVHVGSDQRTHVRLAQTHQGVPVWSAHIVVHAEGSQFLGLNGRLAGHLPSVGVSPTVTAAQALATAKARYAAGGNFGGAQPAFAREVTELVLLPGETPGARAAWHVSFFTELQGGIAPGQWNYFIDAATGQVVQALNSLHTLSQASGPGGNARVTRSWASALDVEPLSGMFAMETARLRTRNLNGGTLGPGSVVFGSLATIGDPAINDAHGFAERTLDMLSEWYGYNSIDGNGLVIRSRVHYDIDYDNAFWDGTQVSYGDGGAARYPLSGAIDVVGHEIHHGFTSFHSNLLNDSQSGGLNESFSDIAGTLVEFFHNGSSADFDIGRDVLVAGGAIRYLCDPPADGVSVDRLDNYVEGMDTTAAAGIPNKAFCLAARRFASGRPDGAATQASVRRVGLAFFEANASYWTAFSNFAQGCEGVMAAASALHFSAEEREWLSQSWQDVGVFCAGAIEPLVCDETLTAESGTITSPNFPDLYPSNFHRTYCIQPQSGNSATLTFSSFDTQAGVDLVRIRDASGAVLSTASGRAAPPPARAPFLAVTFTSDRVASGAGWSASWRADPRCADGTRTASDTPRSIPDNNATGIRSTIRVAESGRLRGLVNLSLSIDHTWRGDLRVVLTSPSGQSRVVHNQTGGSADDLVIRDLPIATFHGQQVAGDWTLQVQDLAARDVGVLESWSLGFTTDCAGGSWSGAAEPNRALVDAGSSCSTLTVQGTGDAAAAKVDIHGVHSWRAALRGTLRHGSSTVTAFPVRTFPVGEGTFRLTGRAAPGLAGSAAGTWTLCIIDTDGFGDFGTLNSWSVHD
jgi:vibriolysin